MTKFSVRSRSRLEPPFFVLSRSHFRVLGRPEQPNKLAAPQHYFFLYLPTVIKYHFHKTTDQ